MQPQQLWPHIHIFWVWSKCRFPQNGSRRRRERSIGKRTEFYVFVYGSCVYECTSDVDIVGKWLIELKGIIVKTITIPSLKLHLMLKVTHFVRSHKKVPIRVMLSEMNLVLLKIFNQSYQTTLLKTYIPWLKILDFSISSRQQKKKQPTFNITHQRWF